MLRDANPLPVMPTVAGNSRPDDNQPAVGEIVATVIEDAEVLHASLKTGSVAQIVIAIIAIVGLLYFLKLVLITSLVAMLIAFVLEPIIGHLARIAGPRVVGALLVVLVAGVLAGGFGYFLYEQVDSFSSQLPQYSERIRQNLEILNATGNRIGEQKRKYSGPVEPLDINT